MSEKLQMPVLSETTEMWELPCLWALQLLTNAEDTGHLHWVIGVLLDIMDAQDVVHNQAIVAHISVHC